MLSVRTVRRRGGFSLVELLVVMALIAAMTLVAAPWFLKISQRNTLKSTARELSITLAAARMRAVKRNLSATVVVTPASGVQGFNRVETFEQVVPTPLKVGEVQLTAQVSFPLVPAGLNPPGLQLTFGPDGRIGTRQQFTVRGVTGSSTTNDVTVAIQSSGSISVIYPPAGWN